MTFFTRKHFYFFVSSFWDELSCKISLLVRSVMLGLFLNTMTVNDKYSHHSRDNLAQPIQMQLSKKKNVFFRNFLLHVGNPNKILHILNKKMSLPA